MKGSVVIRHLYVSPGHNFFGRHGKPAGEHATLDVPKVMCRAGLGLEGDRFFGYRADYKGQVTLFSWAVYEAAMRRFAVPLLQPSAFRRNVLVEGLDLPALVGVRFRLGDVEFLGTEEARPCYWMDSVVAPGAEVWLRGHGGLRVRILCDGELGVGEQPFAISTAEPTTVSKKFTEKSLVRS